MRSKQTEIEYGVAAILIFLAALIPIYMFSGLTPFSVNHYNSYSLQAQSWLQGRLDLPENYGHLEIAVFQNRYFISFPPFPSIVMLPFVLLMGTQTPDHLIALAFSLLAVVYAYRIALRITKEPQTAMFASFFVCAGSNFLHVAPWGAVWYIAQTMAFAFTMLSLFYAISGHKLGKMLSLLFLACAAGCRPFNMLYAPLVCLLLYWDKGTVDIKTFALSLIKQAIPAIALGVFYMFLNLMRFGSIFEFGHNYLPEFTDAPLGQFNLTYLANNLNSIFTLLPAVKDGLLDFPRFDGVAFWIVSPIAIAYAIYTVIMFVKGKMSKKDILNSVSIFLLSLVMLIVTAMHKTMGGYHFGNRYTVDALPFLFLGFCIAIDCIQSKHVKFCYPLALFGCIVNIIGSITYFGSY